MFGALTSLFGGGLSANPSQTVGPTVATGGTASIGAFAPAYNKTSPLLWVAVAVVAVILWKKR